MKAWIIKEIDVLGKWCLLTGVLMTGVMACLLYDHRDSGMSLVGEQVKTLGLVGFAGFGLVLGVVLVLSDTWRGRWGFIVTRPALRTHIFLGKFLAGAILYLSATSIVMIVATILAMDIHFIRAPFAWSMLTPLVFAQLSGVLWIASGMWIAARRASWVGSRLFPAAIPLLIVAMLIATFGSMLSALLVVFILTVIVLVAAAQYFKHNGEYESQPIWVKPVHAIMIGSVTVILLSASIMVLNLMLASDPVQTKTRSYVLDKAGKALIMEFSLWRIEYIDLAGNVVGDLDSRPNATMALETLGWSSDRVTDGQWRSKYASNEFWNSERYLVVVSSGHARNSRSIFDPTANHLLFFNQPDGAVRYASEEGPVNQADQAKRFEGQVVPQTNWGHLALLVTDRVVVEVNVNDNSAREVFRASGDDKVVRAAFIQVFRGDEHNGSDLSAPSDGPPFLDGSGQNLAVLTERSFVILSPRYEPVSIWLDGVEAQTLSIGQSLDGDFFLLFSSKDDSGVSTADVWRVSPIGEVIEKTTLPPMKERDDVERRDTGFAGFGMVSLLIAPSALSVVSTIRYGHQIPEPMWGLMLSLLGGVTSAGLMWTLAVRYGLVGKHRWLWIGLAMLIGVTSLMMLCFLRRLPARTTCACGKRRVRVDSPHCQHCSQPLAPKREPATEIVESTFA